VLCTAAALRALGAEVTHDAGEATWRIRGFGVGGGREPADVLELAIPAPPPACSPAFGKPALHQLHDGRRLAATATDAAGHRTPVAHGARFEARDGGRMPLAIIGTDEMVPIEYRLPVASAQVKSASCWPASIPRARPR